MNTMNPDAAESNLRLQRCRRDRTEALQTREDAWDKQLEVDIEAGKLEHLRKDARRAKKAGKLKTHL
ncbi:MAG: hypothetical protein OXN25_05510 [Candidatus Poribacteria bacterium]|nr:hypothetical protein [Candidatus Poribacteria bacterium]